MPKLLILLILAATLSGSCQKEMPELPFPTAEDAKDNEALAYIVEMVDYLGKPVPEDAGRERRDGIPVLSPAVWVINPPDDERLIVTIFLDTQGTVRSVEYEFMTISAEEALTLKNLLVNGLTSYYGEGDKYAYNSADIAYIMGEIVDCLEVGWGQHFMAALARWRWKGVSWYRLEVSPVTGYFTYFKLAISIYRHSLPNSLTLHAQALAEMATDKIHKSRKKSGNTPGREENRLLLPDMEEGWLLLPD